MQRDYWTGAALMHLIDVVRKWARRRGCDEWQTETAVSLAWYYASQAREVYSASHWARDAVRRVLRGRDLPGCQASARCTMTTLERQGMGESEDILNEEPWRLASDREEWDRLVRQLPQHALDVVQRVIDGQSGLAIAREMGLSEGRVSQIRRAISELWGRDAT